MHVSNPSNPSNLLLYIKSSTATGVLASSVYTKKYNSILNVHDMPSRQTALLM